MFKKFVIVACITLCSFAHAKAQQDDVSETHGIVTPEIATGIRVYSIFNNDTAGNMVICQAIDRGLSGKCNKWTPIQDVVPRGKQYVGFKVVPVGYSTHIQVYWK